MKLIERLADEMVGAEDEGLTDRKAFLRTWRRVRRRFEAIWDPDEIDRQTIGYEVARVRVGAYEKYSEMLTMTER